MAIYHPLNLESLEIRLLRFTSDSDLPQWEMFHASLNDSVVYDALSYTWGEADSDTTVLINGVLTKVSQNLSLALTDIQPRIGQVPIWADALCIDQQNVLERNHQVQQMATIYQRATRIHAWLGRPDRVPPMNLDCLRHLGSILRGATDEDDKEGNETILTAIYDPKMRRVWKELADITDLPYWGRLWIVQEIGLASSLTAHYGPSCVDWKVFSLVRKELAKIYACRSCPTSVLQSLKAILRSIPAQIEEQRDLQYRPAWLEKCNMYLWIYTCMAKHVIAADQSALIGLDEMSANNEPITFATLSLESSRQELGPWQWLSQLEATSKLLPSGLAHHLGPEYPDFDGPFLQKIKSLRYLLQNPYLCSRVGVGLLEHLVHPHRVFEAAIFAQSPTKSFQRFIGVVTGVVASNVTSSTARRLFSSLHKNLVHTLESIPFQLQQHRKWQPLPLKLHNLIETTETSKCKEPRDKIYGLLGLSSNVTSRTMIVDYEKPMFEIYRDVLEHAYNSESRLGQISTMSLVLPRFSQLLQRSIGGPFLTLTGPTVTEARRETSTEDFIFRVVGFIQGSVLPLEPAGLDPAAFSTYQDRVRIMKELFGTNSNGHKLPEYLHPTIDELMVADSTGLAPLLTNNCYATRHSQSTYQPDAANFNAPKRGHSLSPRLFSDESGHVGLAPSTIREDDLLCQFSSCDLALIIRRADQNFKLIGRAVVARTAGGRISKRRRVSSSSLELFSYYVPDESLLQQKDPVYFFLDAMALQALSFPIVHHGHLEFANARRVPLNVPYPLSNEQEVNRTI